MKKMKKMVVFLLALAMVVVVMACNRAQEPVVKSVREMNTV